MLHFVSSLETAFFRKRSDEWECTGATTEEEAMRLSKQDSKYVTTIEGIQHSKNENNMEKLSMWISNS